MFRRHAYVPQVDTRDCGVAALASVAKHFGSEYSLAHLRELAKTTTEGTMALAIVGMSGSGKTTLAKLIVNFYDPTGGTVRIGAADVTSVDRATLRHHVTYLPQEPYIFGSVRPRLT